MNETILLKDGTYYGYILTDNGNSVDTNNPHIYQISRTDGVEVTEIFTSEFIDENFAMLTDGLGHVLWIRKGIKYDFMAIKVASKETQRVIDYKHDVLNQNTYATYRFEYKDCEVLSFIEYFNFEEINDIILFKVIMPSAVKNVQKVVFMDDIRVTIKSPYVVFVKNESMKKPTVLQFDSIQINAEGFARFINKDMVLNVKYTGVKVDN